MRRGARKGERVVECSCVVSWKLLNRVRVNWVYIVSSCKSQRTLGPRSRACTHKFRRSELFTAPSTIAALSSIGVHDMAVMSRQNLAQELGRVCVTFNGSFNNIQEVILAATMAAETVRLVRFDIKRSQRVLLQRQNAFDLRHVVVRRLEVSKTRRRLVKLGQERFYLVLG